MADTGAHEGDWKQDALARAQKLYPGGTDAFAVHLAGTNRYAIQYLEQAPALIAFVAYGVVPSKRGEVGFALRRFGSAVHRQPTLKALLKEFDAPLPIRRLAGQACFPTYLKTIFALRKIPPSVLAQAVPEQVGRQRIWLRALGSVLKVSERWALRGEMNRAAWDWFVPAIGRAAQSQGEFGTIINDVVSVLDMLDRHRDRFNPRVTLAQAIAAAARWHEELARQRTEEAHLRATGFAFTHRFDYGAVPDDLAIVGGFRFVALRSGEELFQEGRAMRHCVATYITRVAKGDSLVISILRDGDRVATLEIADAAKQSGPYRWDSRFRVRQLAGRFNARVPRTVSSAVEFYVAMLNAKKPRSLSQIFNLTI